MLYLLPRCTILTTFYNIAANKEFVEHEIARRQLAIKDQDSNSWFTHTRKLLQKYSLPVMILTLMLAFMTARVLLGTVCQIGCEFLVGCFCSVRYF
jgi:hypothetical protein